MNLLLRRSMTLPEFLEWEEGQPLRYEFDGVGPVAMVGGSVRHAQIQRNLAFALTARLRGRPCQFLGSDLKIQTEEDHARYPDGIVICSPLTGSEIIVDAPIVIFEVLRADSDQPVSYPQAPK
jgi:Uma2 family endonuclease